MDKSDAAPHHVLPHGDIRQADAEEERRRREEAAAAQARRQAEEAEQRRLAEAREEEGRREAESAARALAERRRLDAIEAERAHREAETAARAAEESRRQAEEVERQAERARREAETARASEEARRQTEEAERRRLEAEEAERARREAEAARAAEEARRQAEEAERRRLEAEEAERARREAEAARAAEEVRRQAEEAERRRLEAEEAERVRREAEAARAAEEARRQAEEAERRRLEAEEAERARREAEAARAAEEARRQAEEAERRRLEAEAARAAEEARRQAEAIRAAEETRRRAEEVERRRQEASAAARAKELAVAAERARQAALREEKAKQEAKETEQRRAQEVAEERKRQEAAAAERARKMTEAVQRARTGDEARSRVYSPPPVPTAPPLEVDNPYWQKPPEIFDVLSGAPHAAAMTSAPDYVGRAGSEPALPVTMATGGNAASFTAPESRYDQLSDFEADRQPEYNETVPVPPEKRMYIVMVTPEVAPCAKVGGLGDVILGLGRELMKRGHGVEVICPMYSGMRYDLIEGMQEEYGELWCPHNNEWRAEKVYKGVVEGGLPVNFITGGDYTDRPSIYGYDDDLQRFTYFSRQALEFMYKTNRRPDIIHCHDWATGLVPVLLWGIYEKLGWNNSRVVYTIHNNECQGLCGFGDKLLGLVGLDVKEYMRPDRLQDDAHKNCINMMKGGIVYSNFVTTVSPTYAGELKTASGGRGLQTTLAKNSAKVGGVLNGIDYDSWNPVTDPKLSARYSVGDDFYEKYKNKTALREWLGLWDAWRPIIAVVTRLTHQKGLDLIKHAIFASQKLQAQFVLLGSAPDPKVNNEFLALQHQLRENHDINLYLGYHEDLSHLIYAGSDMFLVPSLYEPCGLTQMISLRYGTVPIVRETGGLVDTVFDLDNSGRGLKDANGFTFRDSTPASLDYGLERAVRLWYDNPDGFNRLARNGMRYDYSWRHPTEHYENIYNYIKA